MESGCDSERLAEGLNLYQNIPGFAGIKKTEIEKIGPLNAIAHSSNSPIEFRLLSQPDSLYNLSSLTLDTTLKLTTKTVIDKDRSPEISLEQNFSQTFIGRVELYLNNVLISQDQTVGNPIRSYFENLLCFGNDAKKGHLQTSLWQSSDEALKKRLTKCLLETTDRRIHFYTRLNTEFGRQHKYLTNRTEVILKIFPTSPQYYLKTNAYVSLAEPKFAIERMNIFVEKITPKENILRDIDAGLKSEPIKYYTSSISIKRFPITAGTTVFEIPNVTNGKLPLRVLMGFQHTEAVAGDYLIDSLSFSPNDLELLSLNINGSPVTPPYEMKYAKAGTHEFDQALRPFHDLLNGTSSIDAITSNLSYKSFCRDTNIYCFITKCSGLNGGELPDVLKRTGNISVNGRFGTALQGNMSAVFYLEYEKLIEVDGDRNFVIIG